jgi:glutamate racemase
MATITTGHHMGTAARILIFDSGVGGLSILQEIRQQYPDCAFFYASDNAAFPYGTKSEVELIERVDLVLHQLQAVTQADIIVVACNTASTVALPRIRERFSLPVIGVVPAIKPAAAISQSKVIGLLATPGTIARDYTQQLINDFARDCEIIRVGSSELVLIAERKLRGESISSEQINAIVAPFNNNLNIDTIVLACTHFPLVKQELQAALPHIRHWIDSGEAIARRVGYWLSEHKLDVTIPTANDLAYFTKEDENIDHLQKALITFGITKIQYLAPI